MDLSPVNRVHLAIAQRDQQVLVAQALLCDGVVQRRHRARQSKGLLHGDGSDGRVGGAVLVVGGCCGGAEVGTAAAGARGDKGSQLGAVDHALIEGYGGELSALGL